MPDQRGQRPVEVKVVLLGAVISDALGDNGAADPLIIGRKRPVVVLFVEASQRHGSPLGPGSPLAQALVERRKEPAAADAPDQSGLEALPAESGCVLFGEVRQCLQRALPGRLIRELCKERAARAGQL